MTLLRCKVAGFLLLVCASVGSSQVVASKPATDFYGDPLPRGAIARLGTTRLRHGSGVLDYALSPDSKYLTSLASEGLLVEWDAETGKERHSWSLAHGPFRFAALSADCKLLATVGLEDKSSSAVVNAKTNRTVRIWDVATGKEIRKITDNSMTIGAIAFSRDGKWLASMSQQHQVHLWDAKSGELIRKLDGKEELLTFSGSLAFSPNGRTLASGGNDGRIRLWDVESGRKLREIQVPGAEKPNRFNFPRYVGSLAFSPDGLTLASAGLDQDVFAWSTANGKEIRRFQTPERRGFALAFSPDGKDLIFNEKDGILRQWEINTGKVRRSFLEGSQPLISTDGKTLYAVRFSSIHRWDVHTAKDVSPARGPTGIYAIAHQPDGETLTTHTSDGICKWETSTGKPLGAFPIFSKHVRVAFSPDGKTAASAGFHDVVCVVDLATGKEKTQIPGQKYITSLAFRPDGKLATVGADVRLTDVTESTSNVLIERLASSQMALSADGKQMLVGLGTIILWDFDTNKPRWQITNPAASTPTFAFSADGRWCAVAGNVLRDPDRQIPEKYVHVYATANGKKMTEFGKSPVSFQAIAFAPDGRTVATGDTEGRIHVWELQTGQERRSFVGHRGAVFTLAFAHDQRTLISGSLDGTALVWRLAPKIPPRDLTSGELDVAWADLAKDAAKAYDAWGTLAASPKQATQFLAKKLQPEKAISTERLAPLIAALGSEQLTERDKAVKELESLGDLAGSALRKATNENLPLEHTRRIRQLLEKLPTPITTEQLRNLRAVEALEYIGNAEARQILTALSKGAPGVRLTQESQAALDRLTKNAKTS